VLASFKIKFLGEVVDGLFEVHTERESTKQYEFSVRKPVYFNRCVVDEPPTPPTDLPDGIVDTLDDYSSELLRDVASYAEELAEYRERETHLEEKDSQSEVEERPDDLPDDVPSKATITIKEINDNRYYYWQWRDGDRVKSKYKGPVNSDK
jgi:hypothetical protein